jgi:type II secretory pathway component PulK
MVRNLFESVMKIDTAVCDRLIDQTSKVNNLALLSELHTYMTDEEYDKVKDFLTVSPVTMSMININAASSEVLQSLGISQGDAERIVQDRQNSLYTDKNTVPGIGNGLTIPGTNILISSHVDVREGGSFKIECDATVGGYTRHVEAVVQGNSVSYWRAL